MYDLSGLLVKTNEVVIVYLQEKEKERKILKMFNIRCTLAISMSNPVMPVLFYCHSF
jgi:hypothetical protein